MHGLQVVATEGPDSVEFNELPEPPVGSLIVDVRAAGVGFPDLLMARGEHQIRQPVPFTGSCTVTQARMFIASTWKSLRSGSPSIRLNMPPLK